MDYMSDLEKFGIKAGHIEELYADNSQGKPQQAVNTVKEKEQEKEEDFLFDKKIQCPVCDKEFMSRTVKSSKARMIGTDNDLRPRFKSIDTLKYGVTSCPYCGYSALNNEFVHLSTTQIHLIRDGVCAKYKADMADRPDVYSYNYAIDKHKLAFFCSVVKKGKASDKAYICLKISWLCRGKKEELEAKGYEQSSKEYQDAEKEELYYYGQALDGMTKAVASESFPICGMDQNTMDILLAQMNTRLGNYEIASKLVSRILVSQTANRKVKDKALDLKDELVSILKRSK